MRPEDYAEYLKLCEHNYRTKPIGSDAFMLAKAELRRAKESEPMTLQDFAIAHELKLVTEQQSWGWATKIAFSDIKDSELLHSFFGRGPTAADSMKDYAIKISGKLLVIHAHRSDRKEIRVPQLTGAESHDAIVQLLAAALRGLYEEQIEYITINHLGDPHHNWTMQQARDALKKAEPFLPKLETKE